MKNKWIKYFKLIVINGLILFLMLEVILFMGAILPIPWFDFIASPRAFAKWQKHSPFDLTWEEKISLNYHGEYIKYIAPFGIWMKPFRKYIQRKSCFEVTNSITSYGARDKERKKNATTKRTIVLGDSFIFGFSTTSEERITERLEKITKRPHLNFGMSDMAPPNYYLCYQHLAQKFSHDAVFVAILPANDMRIAQRPSFQGTYPNYKPVFLTNPESFFNIKELKKKSIVNNTLLFKLKSPLINYCHTYQLLSAIKTVMIVGMATDKNNYVGGYYGNYGETNWLHVRYSCEQIVKLAGKNRKVYVTTLPMYGDFYEYKKRNKQKPALSRRFEKMAIEVGFKYFDLLPPMAEAEVNYKKYYLTCDGHWSAYGNEVAAKLLAEHLLPY